MIPLRDSTPSGSTPAVTFTLIGLNALVFLYQMGMDEYSLNHFFMMFGVVPDQLAAVPFLTSMFLHGGLSHIAGNMWFLWIYGDNVEDVLGRKWFLIFYLVCGIAASVLHVLTNAGSHIPTVGASGAISGVMGAYLLKFPHARITTFLFLFLIDIPAWLVLLQWFGIQFFNGVGTVGHTHLAGAEGGGVAWFAHVGGFLMGMLLIKLLPQHQAYWHRRDLNW
jgi:membrane associated rhomboid family serine protease